MEKGSKDRFLAKRDDDHILSDSDSPTPGVECDTCGVSFSNIKAYDAHMKGKKHKKKVEQVKLVANYKKSESDKDVATSEEDSEDESELRCEVCDKNFTGYGSFVAHLKGSVHAKFVKKQKLKERMSDMPEVLDNTIKEDDDEIIQKPFARCLTCQKEFSGPEPFDLHMKSSAHKKKIEMIKKLDIIVSKHPEEAQHSADEDDAFAKCDVCKKSFSGPLPYHIHMKSSIHKKAVQKKEVAEEMKKVCTNYDPKIGYECKECKKTFTDPRNFKQHLKNNSHEKQKAKAAMNEFLTSFPEIAFVTTFEEKNDAKEENDSDSENPEFFLICKICHASFSGPESAQDHVKSKKHIKLKKEKQLLKKLKEQGKESGAKDKTEKSHQKIDPKSSKTNGVSTSVEAKDAANGEDDFELI